MTTNTELDGIFPVVTQTPPEGKGTPNMTEYYVPAGTEEKTASFAPILDLDEGEQIFARVKAVRETMSEQYGKGELVDCQTIGGIDFTLRGHAILCQKLKPLSERHDALYIIRYCGKVGRAHDYYVAQLPGNAVTIAEQKAGQNEIERVENAIADKIAELPPR
jgi:hypothetical protein